MPGFLSESRIQSVTASSAGETVRIHLLQNDVNAVHSVYGTELHQSTAPFVDAAQGIRIDVVSEGGSDANGPYVDVRIDVP